MKHIGKLLKKHIEDNHIKKGQVAEQAGISYNYLSTIFKRESCDAGLLEKLYVAAGLYPGMVFDVPKQTCENPADSKTHTNIGDTSMLITQNGYLRESLADKERIIADKERIIEEKERIIQILLGSTGVAVSGQNRDNNDK